MRMPFMKQVAWCLVFAMFIIGIVPRVEAGFAPSEIVALAKVDRAADMEGIQKALETKIIKERLEKLGFTQDEISNRFSQLSDWQIHQLALQLDDLKVGGDSGLGVVVALLVILILFVILLQLTDRRVVVK
ncbi:MAG: PA2779 family protein [Proteobacteria bacterium]|nr:PA2779 family protein [Pseudomonadota bacterium]